MATDQFHVTGAVAPASPKTGDQVSLSIAGGNTHSDTGSIGPLNVAIAATGGGTTNITVDAVPFTVITEQDVEITSITDPSGRTWTVAPDGKSATATA